PYSQRPDTPVHTGCKCPVRYALHSVFTTHTEISENGNLDNLHSKSLPREPCRRNDLSSTHRLRGNDQDQSIQAEDFDIQLRARKSDGKIGYLSMAAATNNVGHRLLPSVSDGMQSLTRVWHGWHMIPRLCVGQARPA